MKILQTASLVFLLVGACELVDDGVLDTSGDTADPADTSNVTATANADGVITNLQANGTGGGAPFDGQVDTAADLDDLVETAWGDGGLGLHRGHAPIENVLVTFLGVSHAQMHVYMEQQGMNLAAVSEELDLDPENLIDSLTWSFRPFVEEGVDNGVLTDSEVDDWMVEIRSAFSDRVYWSG